MIIQSKINDTKDVMKRKALEIDKQKIERESRTREPKLPSYVPSVSSVSAGGRSPMHNDEHTPTYSKYVLPASSKFCGRAKRGASSGPSYAFPCLHTSSLPLLPLSDWTSCKFKICRFAISLSSAHLWYPYDTMSMKQQFIWGLPLVHHFLEAQLEFHSCMLADALRKLFHLQNISLALIKSQP